MQIPQINQLMHVQLTNLPQSVTTGTTALRMIKGECIRISDKGFAHPWEQETEQWIDIRISPHRRTGVGSGLPLVYHDSDRQIPDPVYMRTAIFGQVLLHETGERLIQLPTWTGGNGIQYQRRFPGTRDPGEYSDLLLRNIQRDMFQVILISSLDLDIFLIWHNQWL